MHKYIHPHPTTHTHTHTKEVVVKVTEKRVAALGPAGVEETSSRGGPVPPPTQATRENGKREGAMQA